MKRKPTAKSVGKAQKKIIQKISAPESTRGDRNGLPNDSLKSRLIAEDEGVGYGKQVKTVRCEIRLSEKQQRSIEEAAAILGFRTSSEYIRYTIQENARKVIQDQSILQIAERDRERFVREINRAGTPGKALRDAAKYFLNTFETK